ncbi:hypothetical protein Fmac_003579 [Flemingia macrophylla]|uniref:Ankyrin repeat protein n=1 Tax=Flemingia macrophylla TaxID=520843 RepID=A0ABD1NN63_9FABA
MECLVEEGNAIAFLGPLMRAAERGCMQVVEWFVQRGCRDMELCPALTAATSSCQVHIAAYLLTQIPQQVLAALSVEILKAAGERSGGSLDGVAFLLQSDFLGDPAATYAVADIIAKSEDEAVAPELKTFLKEHWSEGAYKEGLKLGQEHYMNLVRIIKWGESPICLRDLPAPLTVAIAYLPLYRECVKAGGCLFSQRLRGQLVEAARRLGNKVLDEVTHGRELVVVLEQHLPHFFLHPNRIVYLDSVANVMYLLFTFDTHLYYVMNECHHLETNFLWELNSSLCICFCQKDKLFLSRENEKRKKSEKQ